LNLPAVKRFAQALVDERDGDELVFREGPVQPARQHQYLRAKYSPGRCDDQGFRQDEVGGKRQGHGRVHALKRQQRYHELHLGGHN